VAPTTDITKIAATIVPSWTAATHQNNTSRFRGGPPRQGTARRPDRQQNDPLSRKRRGDKRPSRSPRPSKRDRRFESGSLQRRVWCELGFRGPFAKSPARGQRYDP